MTSVFTSDTNYDIHFWSNSGAHGQFVLQLYGEGNESKSYNFKNLILTCTINDVSIYDIDDANELSTSKVYQAMEQCCFDMDINDMTGIEVLNSLLQLLHPKKEGAKAVVLQLRRNTDESVEYSSLSSDGFDSSENSWEDDDFE